MKKLLLSLVGLRVFAANAYAFVEMDEDLNKLPVESHAALPAETMVFDAPSRSATGIVTMCGAPFSEYHYAWTGQDLVKLPKAVSFGGEGVETSYSEMVLFPADGGPWNCVIKMGGGLPAAGISGGG